MVYKPDKPCKDRTIKFNKSKRNISICDPNESLMWGWG